MPTEELLNKEESEVIFLRKVDVVFCESDLEPEPSSVEPAEETEPQEQEVPNDTELR